VLAPPPHKPFTAQAALALVQLSLVPPLAPEQVQLELPPHDPATFAVLLPALQLYCVALLHAPLMGHRALALQQLTARPVPVPEHVQVALPPQLPAL